MNRAKQIFCLFLLAFSGALNGSSETADFNFPNKPGNDAVGFRVVLQYDYSRSYRRKVDNMGKSFYGELARPVQTLIWYESRLAAWAADLVEKNHIKEAIDVFKLTLSIYPDSWMAYDGLGEAYENSGDIDSAVKSYKHSVEKYPKDDYDKTQLKKLEK
jgi:tetratricopeptide (TPR) repeat protein